MSWFPIVVIFGAGSVGSLARYLALRAAERWGSRFDKQAWLALFLINITGCIAIGAIEAAIIQHDGLWGMNQTASRLTFTVGLLGGYTSFSAISVTSDNLWREGRRGVALLQTCLSVGLAIPAVLLGRALV